MRVNLLGMPSSLLVWMRNLKVGTEWRERQVSFSLGIWSSFPSRQWPHSDLLHHYHLSCLGTVGLLFPKGFGKIKNAHDSFDYEVV